MHRYRVEPGQAAQISSRDTRDVQAFAEGKTAGKAAVKTLNAQLEELQELLYADGSQKVLIVLLDVKASMRDAADTSATEQLDEAIELILVYIETGYQDADMKHAVLSTLGKVLENLPSIVALIQLLSR